MDSPDEPRPEPTTGCRKRDDALFARRLGASMAQAAKAADVTVEQIKSWRRAGKADIEAGTTCSENARFTIWWDELRSEHFQANVKALLASTNDQTRWKIVEASLRGGVGNRIDVTTPDGEPFPVLTGHMDTGPLSAEEVEQANNLAKKLMGISSEKADVDSL